MGEPDTGLRLAAAAARRILCEGCVNIRDVGGYPTMDGSRTRWRLLLRGDNLCRLTADDTRTLLAYGVRTVIDVRHAHEVAAELHPFDPGGALATAVTYRHLELRDLNDEVNETAFSACPRLTDYYRLTLDRCGPGIAAAIRAFGSAPPGAVLIHCNTGMNRTGVVVALLLALASVAPDTIVADYALSDVYLQPLLTTRRDLTVEEYTYWRPTPEVMRAFLERLDTVHGGPRQYVLAAGLHPEEIDQVRRRLRE